MEIVHDIKLSAQGLGDIDTSCNIRIRRKINSFAEVEAACVDNEVQLKQYLTLEIRKEVRKITEELILENLEYAETPVRLLNTLRRLRELG
jgi:hypothetical protein